MQRVLKYDGCIMRSGTAGHLFAQTHRAKIYVSQIRNFAFTGKHDHPTLHVPEVMSDKAKPLPQTLLPFKIYNCVIHWAGRRNQHILTCTRLNILLSQFMQTHPINCELNSQSPIHERRCLVRTKTTTYSSTKSSFSLKRLHAPTRGCTAMEQPAARDLLHAHRNHAFRNAPKQ